MASVAFMTAWFGAPCSACTKVESRVPAAQHVTRHVSLLGLASAETVQQYVHEAQGGGGIEGKGGIKEAK
jgi:hypothetical protein